MTPSIAPSIFAMPTLRQLGWLADERVIMNTDHSESSPLSDTDNVTQLLERISKRDTQALSALYDAHAGLLMSVIMAVLKDKAESEDILQESFLTIWNKAGMYQPHLGKPTSWMVTIAKNKAYDRYRKLVRQSEGMKVLKDNMVDDPVTSNVSPKADNEELLEGFKELNEDQKKAIELVFYQGFTQQEAATKLDAPLGTVKARIRRGLLQLKNFLNNKSQPKSR